MASVRTLEHQFRLADEALRDAENLAKAGYWASCVSHAYQVALRCAAGLLYGLGVRPLTEREVRVAFASAFVSPGKSDRRFDEAFRTLEKMRHRADFDHEHVAAQEDAALALRLAREFHAEALRIRKEALK